MRTNARLVRESICPCGFPAVSVNVPVGTRYWAYRNCSLPTTWICGGCGKEQQIQSILVRREGTNTGFLPANLFELDDQPKPEETDEMPARSSGN